MTDRQREIWSLYSSGHRVVEIATVLGCSKSTVSTTIKNIKTRNQNHEQKHKEFNVCKYSPSCFSCPIDDCHISQQSAVNTNVLPADRMWTWEKEAQA